MTSQLTTLSLLSFIILTGIIITLIANKIKIPSLLLLILTGIGLGFTNLFNFNQDFITSFAIFALIMILFDSTSRFKIKEISQFSPPALKLGFTFLFLSITIVTLGTHILFANILFSIRTLVISAIFGALMAGTSPEIILTIFKDKKEKIAEILQFESIINTPLTVLIPFIALDFYFGILSANVLAVKFLQGIMTGVGTGFLIGIIVFSLIKKTYQELLSPLIVIATALLTYTLSENIGGNGILAVTTFGIVFGVMTVRDKDEIQHFSSIFTNFLKIVVFILLGLVIKIPLDVNFLIKSLVLFLLYLLVRYLAVSIVFYRVNVKLKEKIFMTLNSAKGVAVATMIFFLGSYNLQGLDNIIDLSFLFLLYTIILSSITARFSHKFIVFRKNVLKKKDLSKE
jgi:cell volume regulation protein A